MGEPHLPVLEGLHPRARKRLCVLNLNWTERHVQLLGSGILAEIGQHDHAHERIEKSAERLGCALCGCLLCEAIVEQVQSRPHDPLGHDLGWVELRALAPWPAASTLPAFVHGRYEPGQHVHAVFADRRASGE